MCHVKHWTTQTHFLTKQVYYLTLLTKDVCGFRSVCSVCVSKTAACMNSPSTFPKFKFTLLSSSSYARKTARKKIETSTASFKSPVKTYIYFISTILFSFAQTILRITAIFKCLKAKLCFFCTAITNTLLQNIVNDKRANICRWLHVIYT